ncbi:Eukaryotic translation initiation factor 4e [Mycena chlorophos]|uniref:Eukaryotic translation initiation factor 4e n=1 Tax=Mycena chlorophos TaxID=658473 RepID=A0A8H6T666_MYCCL|nr:Eukaryotic translation initiation factor 4e [Mycena chlorophos]
MFASLAEKLSGALPSDSSHSLDAIHHSLRSFGQNYINSSSTTPVQRIITVSKGVALDLHSLGTDCKASSKELYTWGQGEADDIKDVSDRIAYINFVAGSLSSALGQKFDAARGPLKNLRTAEANLQPRRNARAALQLQITRIEQDQPRGMEKRLAELRQKLKEAVAEDQPLETEVALLKRQAVRESETQKWEALREYGEKLVILAKAGSLVIDALPKFPPTADAPYEGIHATGAARAALQRALDNYKTGEIDLPIASSVDLSRSDTRSFGITHRHELAQIQTQGSGLSPPASDATSPLPTSPSPPINPSALNLSPAPIPNLAATPESPVDSIVPVPPVPTVAETGVPLSAGASGPGPASGSLRDIKAASDLAGPRTGGLPASSDSTPVYGSTSAAQQSFESASDEKRRLAQAYSQAAQQHETPEEEKKRLEREERERWLSSAGPSGGSGSGKGGPDDFVDDAPPPEYED